MKMKMHRRTLLRGLGASAALFSPLVRSILVEAQGAAKEGNLLVFYTPNGFRRTYFGADGTETNFTMRPTTSVLESQKSDLVVFRNINNMAYPGSERSHNCITRILTCVSGAEGSNTVAAGPSIDHVVAGHFNQNPLVLAVQPQRKDFTWHTQLSWAAAGSAKRGATDSKATFNDLFGTNVGGSGGDPDAARLNRRNKSVLDAVRGDITTLRGRLDSAGKAKLDLHTSTVRELEQSIHRSEVTEMMCDLGMLQTKAGAALPTVPSGTPMSSKAYTPLLQAHGDLQMDIIATALACGQRRAATLLWQECSWEGVNINGASANDSHHNVSHYETDAVAGDGLAQLRDIESFYAARYAAMLNKLRALDILDTTICVWVTDVRESHDQGEFTWIAAGGKDLGIRTGRYHNFAYKGPHNDPRTDANNRTVSDLWVSVKKALGVPGETFGEAKWCHGGLQEYFAG